MLFLYGGAALGSLMLLAGLWLRLGRWPRRRRAYQRGLALLHQGDWRGALSAVRELQALKPLSAQWEGRARNLEGECQRTAGNAALAERKFEEALEHFRTAATLLNVSDADDRKRVVDALMAEVYRLVAGGNSADNDAALQLVARILLLQSPCPEASFWLGVCQARAGKTDLALQALRIAHEGGGKTFVDPPLYLGALQLRGGQPQEALRCLAEANRADANCPLVSWQLGLGLVTAGGDAGMAVRALQRALGTKGLPLWVRSPEKLWREAFPGAPRSFVSRLAAQQPRFACPVFGSDVAVMARQGFLALGQAQYRLNNFAESATIFGNLLQDSAPTLPVLRGLGLALARQGKYDEAFKHLRAAYDMEEPKTPQTTGYLALCGARGKPPRAEDKPNNVLWAVRLLGRFDLAGDAEWAGLVRAVFAEAHAIGLRLEVADLMRCCDILAAVGATDSEAAAAYDQLAQTSLPAVQPVHAWLFGRAAVLHGCRGQAELELFALAYRHAPAGREYFEQRQWDFADLEAIYLLRWAEQNPGRYPDPLGADYAPQGERLLLSRSQKQEEAGDLDGALASTVALVRLTPQSARAHDRWACLEYRRGDVEQAVRVLADWQGLHPRDPWPLLRRAVLEQKRGHLSVCVEALEGALDRARGRFRAEVAFLGARLMLAAPSSPLLASGGCESPGFPASTGGLTSPARPDFSLGEENRRAALRYLDLCLQERPDHAGALTWLAALRAQTGDQAALAAQAGRMDRPDVKDPRFHFLAAVCQLAAGNGAAAVTAGQRIAGDHPLAVECGYLTGLAQLQRGDHPAAIAALEKPALAADGPSMQHARARLGRAHFDAGDYVEAVRWWKQVDAGKRADWKLDEPLRATLFLAALQAYHAGQFAQAAERYREAGKQGYRDRRLGGLLQLALFKAGQQALFESRAGSREPRAEPTSEEAGRWATDYGQREKAEAAATLLAQAIQVGCKDPAAAYLLALAHRRQGKPAEARAALRKIAEPDADVWLQLGLLSLKERQLEQAETEFVKAWELEPAAFVAGADLLLTRLSLGQTAAAASLAPQVTALAPADERRLFEMLQALLSSVQSGNGDARPHAVLTELRADEERRLLGVLRSLGHLDTVCLLMRTLSAARPMSAEVREAHFESVLLKGKKLLDRCEWDTAQRLLTALARQREVAPTTLAALFNMLGCCGCLNQEFPEGARYFAAAVRLTPADAGIHQNLALAHEWQKNLPEAEPHWNRFFDLLERRKATVPLRADYLTRLAYEGLQRLAGLNTEKEKWSNALDQIERAHRLRPEDTDTLERLFHLYSQLRRPTDARRVLQQLRYLKPGEPQYELYELDLFELRELDDIDRWIGEIGRIVQRHPGEARVEERAVTMVGNTVPLLGRMSDQLTEQVNKVIRQVRGLQNYQINWQAVHDVMRDLKREFQKLRKTIGKCLAVVTHPDQRRTLKELSAHVDRKIEFCREWQGSNV